MQDIADNRYTIAIQSLCLIYLIVGNQKEPGELTCMTWFL